MLKEINMPKVGGKKYPYTAKGKAAANKAAKKTSMKNGKSGAMRKASVRGMKKRTK